ncbi:hypothetical protein ACVW0I_000968 [Bradyrhizobium sp. LM6.11]
MAVPMGKLILRIVPATTSPCDRTSARAARCLFWHQDCKFGPDFSLGAMGHAYPTADLSRRACAGVFRNFGACRNGGALRHLHGGYSADDGPARPRCRRLSVHGLHDLRPLGGLGDGRRRPARQAGAGTGHGVEGRRHEQDQVALHLAQGREVSRRQRVRCRCGDLESGQGAQRQGAAIRQAAERAGEDPPALGRKLHQDRRFHSGDHHQDGRFLLSLPDALVSCVEPRAIRQARQGLGQVREPALRDRPIQN